MPAHTTMKNDMEKEKVITKTVWQHTEVLPKETMEFLKGIAADYAKVKTSVYERYSGVGSLGKLGSVYDIMTEMRHCGLREQLELPSVYYELAVRDGVSDIKGMWGVLKNKIRTLITANENLSSDDRMYLRTVLKLDKVYAAVLNREDYPMPEKAAGLNLDKDRLNSLNNLLCRLTRRYLIKPTAGGADSFCVSPGGYSYKNGALYLVSIVTRRRIMLPLKDSKTSARQLRVCIKTDHAAIAIPAEQKERKHEDFQNTIYLHLGYQNMCTLSSGNIYGRELGELSSEKSKRLMEKNRERGRVQTKYRESLALGDKKKAEDIKTNNLGIQKYNRQKNRDHARIETYINAELNRMLKTEKPGRVVITKPVAINKTKFKYKSSNRKVTEGARGYVRKRLIQKCQANGIELEEINSKGTGIICSDCGMEGERLLEGFVCKNCGFRSTIALNGARNIEKKYKELQKQK